MRTSLPQTQVRLSWLIMALALVALCFTPACVGDSGGSGAGSTSPSFGSGNGGTNPAPGGDGGSSTTPTGDGASSASDTPGFAPSGDGQGPTAPIYCTTDDDCQVPVPACDGVKCVACTADVHCTGSAAYCSTSTHICLACLTDSQCGPEEVCTNGECVSKYCTPGETMCNGANLMTCRPDGLDWEPSLCDSGLCEDGACVLCTPACTDELVCWQGECLTCKPFTLRCNGNVVEQCTVDGEWALKYDCAANGIVCFEPGYCASACGGDPKFNNSNSGCDYWAVDLDNHFGAQDSPYAVIVTNLSDTPATVTVTKQDGADLPLDTVIELDVLPDELRIIDLPSRQPQGAKLGWFGYRIRSTNQIIAYQFNPLDNVDVFSNDASLLLPVNTYGKSYRVFSMPELLGGGPPIGFGENCNLVCGQYSGGQCLDDGAGGLGCALPYRGTMTVVAPESGTVVSITPTTMTLAGTGVQAMLPGQTYTYELSTYQILNIKTDTDGGDLTGTLVTADKPVGVFGGHEASVTSDRCCADHLEQQMFPVSTWGTTYIATKAFERGQEADYWRIMAAENGTTITLNPAIQPNQMLNAGQWVEVVTDQDFVVSADKPIGVAQVLPSSQETISVPQGTLCTTSAECHAGYECLMIDLGVSVCAPPACFEEGTNVGCPGGHTCACFDTDIFGNPTNCRCSTIGDPALIVHASAEQYRSNYVFLTPDKYIEDYVNIVAPADATVTLDGTTIGGGYFTAIPAAGYKVARIKVGDGVHRVEATQPIGVVAYGFDRDVSYGYMAGLNLQKLTGE